MDEHSISDRQSWPGCQADETSRSWTPSECEQETLLPQPWYPSSLQMNSQKYPPCRNRNSTRDWNQHSAADLEQESAFIMSQSPIRSLVSIWEICTLGYLASSIIPVTFLHLHLVNHSEHQRQARMALNHRALV
jgi:hypothetical protein